MKLFKRISFVAVLLLALIAENSGAQQAAPTPGRDFTVVNPPQPVSTGSKIEVQEFFWFGCMHCFHLEEPLKAWLKRKPADVDFRYVPAIFDVSSWGPLARTFYALDALGVEAKYHDDIFNAIHRNNQQNLISNPQAIGDFLATKGLSKPKFLEAYNSFAVNSRTQRSVDLTRIFDIPGTPSIVVDGKFQTGPSMTVNADGSVNYDRFFRVVDQLIAEARKERTGKK